MNLKPAYIKSGFQHLPETFRLAWNASPKIAFAILSFTLLSSLFPLAVVYIGKLLIDAIVAGQVDLAVKYVALECGAVVVQTFVSRALLLSKSIMGSLLANKVNILVLSHAVSFPFSYFEDSEFYDQLTRARREASSRPVNMLGDVLTLAQSLITLLGFTSLLFTFSPWAVSILLLSTVPAMISETKFSNSAFRLRNFRSPDTRRLNYLDYVLGTDGYAKEIKSYGVGPMLLEQYKNRANIFFEEDKKLAVQRSVWGFLLSILAIASFYGCYLMLAKEGAAGILTLGTVTLYIAAFRQGQQCFQTGLASVSNMYEHGLYLSNLFSFLAKKPQEREKIHSPVPFKSESGIRFENVSFRYPGAKDWALHQISLFIQQGEFVGIVGENGAGKTTLIKLLCGLYHPTEGRILVDGLDIDLWDPEALKLKFSTLFQDFSRYQFTLSDNISLSQSEHAADKGRIEKASELGAAKELLGKLPSGFDTQLGRWFSDGVELSGGQWQRVALSRTFFRKDAAVLILDEPTASFDAISEETLFDNIKSMAQGKTIILISHRFSTVRQGERIIVLNEGRIIEDGDHTSLLQQNGFYSKMYEIQAKGYR